MSKRTHDEVFHLKADGSCNGYELGEDGVNIARTLRRAIAKKRRVGMTELNTAARKVFLAVGATIWARMCATYGDLPDVGFRYCVSRTDSDNVRILYAVFNDITAVVLADMDFSLESICINWEAQVCPDGWIGWPNFFVNRGERSDANHVASTLCKAQSGSLEQFFQKMFDIENHRIEPLIEARCAPPVFPDVAPAFAVTFNKEKGELMFDGVTVCKRGSAPHARLPVYFDPVRKNARFWTEFCDYVARTHSVAGK